MTVTQPPYDPDALVLVGASVRAAAESAHRANFRVIGIDLFGDTDTRRVCQQFFKISGSANPGERESDTILDACAGLPMLQVGGFSGRLPLIDRLSSVCTQLGPSHSQGAQLRDPVVLESLADRCGLRIPPTWPSSRPPTSLDHDCQRRWLVKEKDSSGGLGIRWWSRDRVTIQDAVIQKWVPGRNFGATFLSDGSQVRLLGICRSLFTRKGSWPFVYAGSVGPVRLSDSIVGRLERLGQSVVGAMQVVGPFNADVIVDRQGEVWLLEINSRWSSSMELIERGLNVPDVSSDGMSLIGSAIKREWIPGRISSQDHGDRLFLKRIVYARRPRQFAVADWTTHLGRRQSLHDVPADGQTIGRDEPILTLITEVDRAAAEPLDCYKTLLRQMC